MSGSNHPITVTSSGASLDLNGSDTLDLNIQSGSIGFTNGRAPVWFDADPFGEGEGGTGTDVTVGVGPIYGRTGTDGSSALGVTALGLAGAEIGQTGDGSGFAQASVLGQPVYKPVMRRCGLR